MHSCLLLLIWTLQHHNTKPVLIFSRVRIIHLERLDEGTWFHSFGMTYCLCLNWKPIDDWFWPNSPIIYYSALTINLFIYALNTAAFPVAWEHLVSVCAKTETHRKSNQQKRPKAHNGLKLILEENYQFHPSTFQEITMKQSYDNT